MNYLAHAYFSFRQEEILIGNLISDFVKGKAKFSFSAGIQKGIALHRSIDRFTDEHAATKAAKIFFRPAVGLYCGAFMDVVYDHFLANDPAFWCEGSLEKFTPYVYNLLSGNFEVLPTGLQQMLPYMTTQDWLFNYRFRWGVERSFEGIMRRAAYLNSSDAAFEAFLLNYDNLKELSQEFLAAVKKFAEEEFNRLQM